MVSAISRSCRHRNKHNFVCDRALFEKAQVGVLRLIQGA